MDDLISRRAAIEALDKRFDNVPMENTTEILMLRKDLRELPAVQAELLDAEWAEMPGTFSQDNEKDIPPHGRLIDADAMYDRLIRLKDKSIRAGDWLESFAIGFTLGFMSKEQTVIEATAGRGKET